MMIQFLPESYEIHDSAALGLPRRETVNFNDAALGD
jgi:hypothetical protein